jgi:hypothetical protein
MAVTKRFFTGRGPTKRDAQAAVQADNTSADCADEVIEDDAH